MDPVYIPFSKLKIILKDAIGVVESHGGHTYYTFTVGEDEICINEKEFYITADNYTIMCGNELKIFLVMDDPETTPRPYFKFKIFRPLGETNA